MSEPRQASLRRLRQFDVRPNRELGQNFLIDDNLLRVIERAAELDPADVVLEVGGGLGVLSEHLAPRVGHLHVVEVDRALEPALADALAPFGNASLHLADAVKLDFAALEPVPTKVVANLPYGVAATVLLKSIEELPEAGLWVAMVQREVGERLAAEPGGRTYGASSVLAQLACEVRVLRKVPRTVFHPAPHVDSVLVTMRRRGGAPGRGGPRPRARRLRAPAQGAGRLARARAGSAARAPRRGARRARGHGAPRRRPRRAARARRLDPARGGARVIRELAPAKLNLVLHVGPPDGGMHPIASLFASLELADELELAEAGEDRVICPGVVGENLAAVALRELRERLLPDLPPLAVRIDKRIPIAAGLGGGSADAAAVLRGANRIAGSPLGVDELRALAARLGSDVPSQVEPGHWVVTGTGERLEPIELAPVDLVLVPDARGLTAAEVYAELDRSEGWRELLDPEPLRGLAGSGPRELAAVLENDLEPPARTLLPEIGAALDALRGAGALGVGVSGSGPTCFGLFDGPDAARAAWEAIPGSLPTRLRRR